MFWLFLKKNYLTVYLNTLHATQQWFFEKEVAASIRAIDPYILIRCTVFALSTTFSNLELWTAFI